MNEIAPNNSRFLTRAYKIYDLRLKMGHRLQLDISGWPEPVPASLLGYLKGATLIVKMPSGRSTSSYPLVEGDVLGVRGFSGRVAFSFKTVIVKIRYAPYRYCHLKFPASIQGTEIRLAVRVRVDLPVKVVGGVAGGEGVEAVIVDISAAGAMLVSFTPLGEAGDHISLTFRFWAMPNDYELNMTVAAVLNTVSSSGQQAGETRYGVRFEAMRSTETILLQNLIYQRLQESPDATV